MTTRDLVNYILLTGQKGYKDMEDGNRISDKMTLLVKEHIKAEADKMVEERLREELIKYDQDIPQQWIDSVKYYWGQRGNSESEVDEYLKSRDSHE